MQGGHTPSRCALDQCPPLSNMGCPVLQRSLPACPSLPASRSSSHPAQCYYENPIYVLVPEDQPSLATEDDFVLLRALAPVSVPLQVSACSLTLSMQPPHSARKKSGQRRSTWPWQGTGIHPGTLVLSVPAWMSPPPWHRV